MEQEQKKASVLASDDGRFLKKSNLGQTVVTGASHVSKRRPDTAPEGSSVNIRHGTYKVAQLRPHTTQSDQAKTRKLTKEEQENKRNVSGSPKSSTPRKKAHAQKATGTVNSDDKLQNSRANIISKPENSNRASLGQDCSFDVENLLYHPSDFVVTSIVDNPKIKKIVVPKWDAKTMGITTLTAEQLLKASTDEQAKYFNEISRLLEQPQRTSGHSGGQRSKLHCASYLASILQNTDVANVVANSKLVTELLQVIKQSSSADLKARLGNGIGN